MSETSGILRTMTQASQSTLGRVTALAIGLGSVAGCSAFTNPTPYAPENNYLVGIKVPNTTDMSGLTKTTIVLGDDQNPNNMMLAFGYCSKNQGLVDMMCTNFATGAQTPIRSGDMQAVVAFAATSQAIAAVISSVASIKIAFMNQSNGTTVDVGGQQTTVTQGGIQSTTTTTLQNKNNIKANADATNRTGITDTVSPVIAPTIQVAPTINTAPPTPPMGKWNNGNTSFNEMRIPGYSRAWVTHLAPSLG